MFSLIKFNMTTNSVSSYYLKLLARDPDVSPSYKTFQVWIDEKSFGRLDFTCSVARLKEEAKGEGDSAKESFMPHYHGDREASVPFVGELALWPSAADVNDESRFYMVNRSEWGATGWIFMYLVLVIYLHDKFIVTVKMSLLGKLCGGKFTVKQGSMTRRSGE
ncbi:unnamed protein product [Brassica rapa]|uniref:Uncharacterized protein n=1 Tax=Brassica campestris TaxID=3711 RepID=A0A8D9M9P0_BRACM|nr:unnamed protein product [Brassica rapa]